MYNNRKNFFNYFLLFHILFLSYSIPLSHTFCISFSCFLSLCSFTTNRNLVCFSMRAYVFLTNDIFLRICTMVCYKLCIILHDCHLAVYIFVLLVIWNLHCSRAFTWFSGCCLMVVAHANTNNLHLFSKVSDCSHFGPPDNVSDGCPSKSFPSNMCHASYGYGPLRELWPSENATHWPLCINGRTWFSLIATWQFFRVQNRMEQATKRLMYTWKITDLSSLLFVDVALKENEVLAGTVFLGNTRLQIETKTRRKQSKIRANHIVVTYLCTFALRHIITRWKATERDFQEHKILMFILSAESTRWLLL